MDWIGLGGMSRARTKRIDTEFPLNNASETNTGPEINKQFDLMWKLLGSHCRGNSTVCTRNVVSKMNPMQFNLIGNKILTTTGTEEKGKKDQTSPAQSGYVLCWSGSGYVPCVDGELERAVQYIYFDFSGR